MLGDEELIFIMYKGWGRKAGVSLLMSLIDLSSLLERFHKLTLSKSTRSKIMVLQDRGGALDTATLWVTSLFSYLIMRQCCARMRCDYLIAHLKHNLKDQI